MTSPIDTILDKESCTLEELLEEDDLIQECRSLNGRLVSFLSKKHNVEAMLRYMLEIPLTKMDEKTAKYSWQSCEVFCCEADTLISTLLTEEDILEKFLSTLDQEETLNPTSAGNFSRVMNHVLSRKAHAMAENLMQEDQSLTRFIHHLEDLSMVEVVIKLLGADDQTNSQLGYDYKSWLNQTDVLNKVVAKMNFKEPKNVQMNAAQVLIAIVRCQTSFLRAKLLGNDILDQLLKYAVESEDEIPVPVLNVFIAALDPKRRISDGGPVNDSFLAEFSMAIDLNTTTSTGATTVTIGALPASSIHLPLLQNLISLIPNLTQRLHEREPQNSMSHAGSSSMVQSTPYGFLIPPLGQGRLKILELMTILLSTQLESSVEAILSAGVLQISMELFVKYPFNNILHKHVAFILTTAIKSKSQPLHQHLFEKLDLLKWLMSIPQIVDSEKTKVKFKSPDESKVENGCLEHKDQKLKVGYMGYITSIANQISVSMESNDYLKTILTQNKDWEDYLKTELKPRNALADLRSWKCGRPPDGLISGEEDSGMMSQDTDVMIVSNGGTTSYDVLNGDDEDHDESAINVNENSMSWNSIPGVLGTETGDITGTPAMIQRLSLAEMTASGGYGQPGHGNDSSSTTSSSSNDSGSQSSSSLDSGSSDEEEQGEEEIQQSQQTEAMEVSQEPADDYSSFNYWRVNFPDVDLPE